MHDRGGVEALGIFEHRNFRDRIAYEVGRSKRVYTGVEFVNR